MTLSGTPNRSLSNLLPLTVSDNDDVGPSPAAKLKAEAFPSLPPRAPSKFPSLDPLGSQGHIPVKKPAGMRSVSEKVLTTKPPPPVTKIGLAETRIRRRTSNPHSSRRSIVYSDDSDENESPKEANIYEPQPFPMGPQGLNDIRSSDKAPPKDTASKAQPFPMSIQPLHRGGSPLSPSDKIARKKDGPTAQPFPLTAQLLNSIGSSPIAGPSNLKRSSSATYDEHISKKMKKSDPEEDAEEEIDPETLCPYCDAPLPSGPTSQLKRLLDTAATKSRPEPRPGNRLGRTAPFTVYIAVCQRHRFESQMLPEAERNGWPKTIDWSELGKRVRKMKDALRDIIEDNGGVDSDLLESGDSRPRARCVFWTEALEEVRAKGTRAVAGVRGQFASFEKTQPG
ncbi:hypothetical protein C0992_009156 [Termitomyces sp. T32_za158]|nr:hypothetical protein C0992_009156 [Termitomyces sp. T32_za158]